jgi:hypothetical protein
LEELADRRSFVIAGAALSTLFLPKRWLVGINMMLIAVLTSRKPMP